VLLGGVAVPLIRLGLSAILTHEDIAPPVVSEGVVGVGVVAQVTGDDDLVLHELIILYYRPRSIPNLRKSKKSCCRKCLGIHDLEPLAAAPPKFVKGKIKKPPRDAPPEGCPFPDGPLAFFRLGWRSTSRAPRQAEVTIGGRPKTPVRFHTRTAWSRVTPELMNSPVRWLTML